MRLSVGAALLLVSALASGIGLNAQEPPGGTDLIVRYSGTWNSHVQHLATPFSQAGTEDATVQNDCAKSAPYLTCRQTVNGQVKSLLVFVCRDRANCTSSEVPANGTATSRGLTLGPQTWTYSWTVTQDGKTTWFRTVTNWASEFTIQSRQEFSTDQQHWTPMATGQQIKIPGR